MLKRLLIFGALLLSLMPLSAQQKTYKEKQNYKNWVRIAPKFEDDFFKTKEAVRIGDNVLLYQLESGGWPKNIFMPAELSKEEIKKVKKLAQEMLGKIKARIHELDHWRDKEETQSIISVLIRDLLWANLPDSYSDNEIAIYKQTLYEYVYNTYPAA